LHCICERAPLQHRKPVNAPGAMFGSFQCLFDSQPLSRVTSPPCSATSVAKSSTLPKLSSRIAPRPCAGSGFERRTTDGRCFGADCAITLRSRKARYYGKCFTRLSNVAAAASAKLDVSWSSANCTASWSQCKRLLGQRLVFAMRCDHPQSTNIISRVLLCITHFSARFWP